MTKRSRIPTLSLPQYEAIAKRIRASGLRPTTQQTILESLNAASNPDAETPEFGFASLPKERREIAKQSIQATSTIFTGVSRSTQVDFAEQQDVNQAVLEAQGAGEKRIEWEWVLALLVFFLFPKEQEKTLHDSILNAYIASWQLAIREQASRYGCQNFFVGQPRGASLNQMKEWAKRDTDSIVATYNADAQRALQSLYDANPLGTSAYYIQGMAEWADNRQKQKNLTIGINNVQAGYQLGLQDFHVNNNLQTQYRFTGAPPICPICIQLMALGAVDYFTMASNPAPVHPNCPHYWESTSTYTIACGDMWTG